MGTLKTLSISEIFESQFPGLSQASPADPLKRLVESLEKSHLILEQHYERLFQLYQDSFSAHLNFYPLAARAPEVCLSFTPSYCPVETTLERGATLFLRTEERNFVFKLGESVTFTATQNRKVRGTLLEQTDNVFLKFLEGVPFEELSFPKLLLECPETLILEKPDGTSVLLKRTTQLNSCSDSFVDFPTYGGALIPRAPEYASRFQKGIKVKAPSAFLLPKISDLVLPLEISLSPTCSLKVEEVDTVKEGQERESQESFQNRFQETLNIFYKFKASYSPKESFMTQLNYFRSSASTQSDLSKKEVTNA